jgi:type I restriction enzyme S subunit
MVNMNEIFKYDFIDDTTPMELVPVTENELNTLLVRNDLLFARQSLIESGAGKISIYRGDSEVVFESHLIRCRIDESLASALFLYYFFKSPVGRGLMSTIVYQTAAAGIRGSDLMNLEVPKPPIAEQRAIVSVLSSLDAKIDLLHRQNKTLEAMAETLFRQWFVEEAEEGWVEVRLGAHVGTNERSLKKDSPLSCIKYLDTGSITKGHIEGLEELAMKDAPSRARRLVQHNDIVYSTVRPSHCHYGMIKDPPADLVVSTGFCVVTAKTLGPHFVYYLLTTPDMTEFLHSVAEGSTSTYPSLKPSDIEAVEFQLPPKKRMEEFEAIAAANWDKISNNYRQIKSFTALRDTLLPKLMSGEVRVEVQ